MLWVLLSFDKEVIIKEYYGMKINKDQCTFNTTCVICMYNWNYFNIILFKILSAVVSSERIQLVNIKSIGEEILDIIVLQSKKFVLEKKNLLLYLPDAAASLCLCIKVAHEGNCFTLHGIWSGSDISSDLFFQKIETCCVTRCGQQQGKREC